MVQTAINTFYNREQEKEAKAQERERRKEIRAHLAAGCLPGKPYGKPQVLEGQGRRKMPNSEDEMGRWLHQLDGHEFEQAPGVGDG